MPVLCACGEGAAPPDPRCPAHAPMVDKSSWTFVIDDPTVGSGSWTERVERVIDRDDWLRVEVEGTSDLDVGGLDYHSTLATQYLCDADGLKLTRATIATDPAVSGPGSRYEAYYDPALLLVPHDLSATSAWSADGVRRVATLTQESTPQDGHWESAARAVSVDTPAGTFEAIEVITTFTAEGSESTAVNAYATGPGRVATNDWLLEWYYAP